MDKSRQKLKQGRTGEKWPYVPICCELSKVCYVREGSKHNPRSKVMKKIGRYCPKHGLTVSETLFEANHE